MRLRQQAALLACLFLSSAMGHAPQDAPAQDCTGGCVNERPVNFRLHMHSTRLAAVTRGTLRATTEDGVAVRVTYSGSAAFGVGDAANDVRHPAARVPLRGTAGAATTLRIRLSRAQLSAVRRQAKRHQRRSVILFVRLRGEADDDGQKVRNDFKFRLRVG